MPDTTAPVAADLLDRITNLFLDERAGALPAIESPEWQWAFMYLNRLLLGGAALARHLAHLEKLYQAEFRCFPFRRDRAPGRPVVPGGPNPKFPHRDLLPEGQALAIAERGPQALRDRALFPEGERNAAALLLNPYALWDLADLVDSLLPDYWLEQMTVYGPELAAEVGIDLSAASPLADPREAGLTEEQERKLALAGAARRDGGPASPREAGPNKWEITPLPDWARRKLAAVAFGNPEQTVTLFLHRIPRGAEQAQAELEILPAPTKRDVTVNVRFRTGHERSFVLEVPEQTREDPTFTLEHVRSSLCEGLPDAAFRFSAGDFEPVGDWFRVVFRSVLFPAA